MKILVNFFAGLALVGTFAATQSCSKTETTVKTCSAWRTGANCDSIYRDKVIKSGATATYTVQAGACASAAYDVVVTPSSTDTNTFFITDFSYLVCTAPISVSATITGSQITFVPKTGICGKFNLVSGSGSVTGSGAATTINCSYTIDSAGQNSKTCTETWKLK